MRRLGEREEAEEDDERARGPRFTGLGDLDTDLETDRRVGLVRGGGVGDLRAGDFFGDFFGDLGGGGEALGDFTLGGGGRALSLTSLGSFVTSFTSLVSFSFTSFLVFGALLFSFLLLLLLDPLLLRLDPL